MKIAYCISAYTDPEQLARLINSLHSDAHYFIHVDKNVDINKFHNVMEGRNIHYIEQIYVRWATLSQVEYQMKLLQAAIDYPSEKFDYIFMLSGFDYPLWSTNRITAFLEYNRERNHLWAMAVETTYYLCDLQREIWPDFEIRQLGKFCNRALRAISRKVLKILRIKKTRRLKMPDCEWMVYKGSDYFCISCELAQYVVKTYRNHDVIRKYFKNTFAPSECVIHTIIFNSAFAGSCTLIKGKYKGLDSLTPLHYIDGCHIKVLSEMDFEKLIASGKMFARKFRTGTSEKLIHMLDFKHETE